MAAHSAAKRTAEEEAASSAASTSTASSSAPSKRPRTHHPGPSSGQAQAPNPSTSSSSASAATSAPARAPKPVSSVYVSNLPLDATQDELAAVFSRYGVLLEDDTGSAANRIKLYRDPATGVFTGDALITYFKPESVELAVNVLDESCLRAHLGQREPVMRVRRAEFGKDKERDGGSSGSGGTKASSSRAGNGGGTSITAPTPPTSSSANGKDPARSDGGAPANPDKDGFKNGNQAESSSSGGRRQLTDADKRKVQKRMAKLQSKLDGWDSASDEDGPGPGLITSTTTSTGAPGQVPTLSGDLSAPTIALDPALASSRTVILTKMFTLAELDEDPALLLDLKEEVREECETLGKVTNVVLYDKEPEGIMSVKFADVLGARACVAKMNNRFFAGRTISAFLSHGKPKYRRTGVRDADEDVDDIAGESLGGHANEEAKRRDAFGAWLEGGGDDADTGGS